MHARGCESDHHDESVYVCVCVCVRARVHGGCCVLCMCLRVHVCVPVHTAPNINVIAPLSAPIFYRLGSQVGVASCVCLRDHVCVRADTAPNINAIASPQFPNVITSTDRLSGAMSDHLDL